MQTCRWPGEGAAFTTTTQPGERAGQLGFDLRAGEVTTTSLAEDFHVLGGLKSGARKMVRANKDIYEELRGAAFRMRVLAVDVVKKEKPEFDAQLRDVEQLGDLLAASDFVVICVPYTDRSVNLIGAEQLRQMKKTAYLINVTRGVVVDLDALVNALETGEIAGAGLDAFAIEPLPSEHPLWTMENVVITPHKAGVCAHWKTSRRINVLKENLRRFIVGESLINLATKEHWF